MDEKDYMTMLEQPSSCHHRHHIRLGPEGPSPARTTRPLPPLFKLAVSSSSREDFFSPDYDDFDSTSGLLPAPSPFCDDSPCLSSWPITNNYRKQDLCKDPCCERSAVLSSKLHFWPESGATYSLPQPFPADCPPDDTQLLDIAGVLDSPPVMRSDYMQCCAPLSPPPTQPSTSSTLPELEEDDSLSDFCADECGTAQVLDDGPSGASACVGSCGEECGCCKYASQASQELLSPISPTLESEGMPTLAVVADVEESTLLAGSSPDAPSILAVHASAAERSPVFFSIELDDDEPSFLGFPPLDDAMDENVSGAWADLSVSQASPLTPQSPAVSMEGESEDDNLERQQSRLGRNSPSHLSGSCSCASTMPNFLVGTDPPPFPPSKLESPLICPDDTDTPHLSSLATSYTSHPSLPSTHLASSRRPVLSHLDLPEARHIPFSTFDAKSDNCLSIDHRDEDTSATAIESPLKDADFHGADLPSIAALSQRFSKPLLGSLLNDLTTITEDDGGPLNFQSHSTFKIFADMDSSTRCLARSIDDADESLASPPSPSLRLCAALPMVVDAPPSPSPSLISLPGVETDEELIPPAPPEFTTDADGALSAAAGPSPRSLLFIDDPNDVPFPRSPSPEDFDLDLDDESADPDLVRLYHLRKRYLAAERGARQQEVHTEELRQLGARGDPQRRRKWDRERSKEIGALLRLKIGNALSGGEVAVTAPKRIGSMAQLVARMLFRRHDTSRPPTSRKSYPPDQRLARSSLSHSFVTADLEKL